MTEIDAEMFGGPMDGRIVKDIDPSATGIATYIEFPGPIADRRVMAYLYERDEVRNGRLVFKFLCRRLAEVAKA